MFDLKTLLKICVPKLMLQKTTENLIERYHLKIHWYVAYKIHDKMCKIIDVLQGKEQFAYLINLCTSKRTKTFH